MQSVDVLLPAHKSAGYLRIAIDSILRQTYPSINLLIVDDSEDGSVSRFLAAEYSKGQFKVVKSGGVGIVGALNLGLDFCNSDYVARIDSDDVCHPRKIQKQVEFLVANEEIDVLGTAAHLINETGRKLGGIKVPNHGEEIKNSLLYLVNPMIHPSVIIKRKVFDLNQYSSAIPNAEDYELWVRLAPKYVLANLPIKLMSYRIHPDQMTRIHKDQHQSQQISKVILDSYLISTLPMEARRRVREFHENLLLLNSWVETELPLHLFEQLIELNEKFGSYYVRQFLGGHGLMKSFNLLMSARKEKHYRAIVIKILEFIFLEMGTHARSMAREH